MSQLVLPGKMSGTIFGGEPEFFRRATPGVTGAPCERNNQALLNRKDVRAICKPSESGFQPSLGSGPAQRFRDARHDLCRRGSGKGSIPACKWPGANNAVQ